MTRRLDLSRRHANNFITALYRAVRPTGMT
jgi:hypothetical protein